MDFRVQGTLSGRRRIWSIWRVFRVSRRLAGSRRSIRGSTRWGVVRGRRISAGVVLYGGRCRRLRPSAQTPKPAILARHSAPETQLVSTAVRRFISSRMLRGSDSHGGMNEQTNKLPQKKIKMPLRQKPRNQDIINLSNWQLKVAFYDYYSCVVLSDLVSVPAAIVSNKRLS